MTENEKVTILIVDDMQENLLIFERMLIQPDYEIHCALNANEAIALFNSKNIAIFLLDVQMPGTNGFQLAEIIRSNEKYRTTPIIFITAAHKDPSFVLKGYEVGAVDYLFKPVEKQILTSKVEVFAEIYRNLNNMRIEVEQHREMERQLVDYNKELVHRRDYLQELVKDLEIELKKFQEKKEEVAKLVQADSIPKSHEQDLDIDRGSGSIPNENGKIQGALVALPHLPIASGPKQKRLGIRDSLHEVISMIQNREFLPIIPLTAKRVLDIINQPKITIQHIGRELKYDQSVTFKLMGIANSAFYRSESKVDSIERAIARIGLDETIRHLNVFVTKEIFKVSSPILNKIAEKLSDHSAASAIAAEIFASRRNIGNTQTYFLATLFHDIGKLWVLQIINEIYAKEKDRMDLDSEGVLVLFAQLHQKLGAALLRKWNFDDLPIEVALRHHEKYDHGNNGLLISQLGNVIAKISGYSEKTELPNEEELSIFQVMKLPAELVKDLVTQTKRFMSLHRSV